MLNAKEIILKKINVSFIVHFCLGNSRLSLDTFCTRLVYIYIYTRHVKKVYIYIYIYIYISSKNDRWGNRRDVREELFLSQTESTDPRHFLNPTLSNSLCVVCILLYQHANRLVVS